MQCVRPAGHAGSRPGGRGGLIWSCAECAAVSGCAPDCAVTFFCFAKRKSPKKRRPRSLLRCSAHTEGEVQSTKSKQPECKTPQGRAMARPCGRRFSVLVFGAQAVMRRREAQVQPDKGWRCLSEASLARPRLRRASQRARRADESGSPSLCLLSLGEARESKSPAGARPGMPRGPSKQTNNHHIDPSCRHPCKARPRRKTPKKLKEPSAPTPP